MRLRRLVAACALGVFLALFVPSAASAHPLGNFTVNQASALRFDRDRITIDHVVDMAEIPTFQARGDIDRNHDGQPSASEGRTWSQRECDRIAGAIDLTVDGNAHSLTSGGAAVSFPPGQAGLPTLRLVCRLTTPAALGAGRHHVRFSDYYRQDRIGWREITAVGDHTTILGRVPTASPSASLTHYPTDQLSSPLDQRTLVASVRGGGAAAPTPPPIPTATGSVVRGFDDLTQSLTSSVSARRLTVGLALVAVAIAIGLGALHAFAPGHGKTVMAAYLVGERGTIRDGLLIGVTVATTHTLGVLLLGIVLTASQTFAPEAVYPYLSLASGMCFAGLGLALLFGAIRRRRVGLFGLHHHHGVGGHTHGPEGHTHAPSAPAPVTTVSAAGLSDAPAEDHVRHQALAYAGAPAVGPVPPDGHLHGCGHDHTHDHDPTSDHDARSDHDRQHAEDQVHHHDHAHAEDHRHDHGDDMPEVALSRRRLLTLGFAGGLVPTPTAIVVLLGATAIGRAWFGALLVVAYGLGMGGTLVLAGLLLARARRRFDLTRHSDRALRIAAIFPVATAIVITASGLWLVARAAIAV